MLPTTAALAGSRELHKTPRLRDRARGRQMGAETQGFDTQGFDYGHYRRLLAEAVDEPKRLALIRLLIDERAMHRLAEHTASQRRQAHTAQGRRSPPTSAGMR